MRRRMFMAALSATLLGVPVSLCGQTGGRGGMAMRAPRGGYVAHGSGFVGAPRGAYWGGGFHSHPGHLPYYPRHYPYFRYRYPWWGYRGYYAYPWGLGWYSGLSFVGSDAGYSYPAESNPAYAYPPPDNSSAYIANEQQQ